MTVGRWCRGEKGKDPSDTRVSCWAAWGRGVDVNEALKRKPGLSIQRGRCKISKKLKEKEYF